MERIGGSETVDENHKMGTIESWCNIRDPNEAAKQELYAVLSLH